MSADSFGLRLRTIRKNRNMTQKELADRLGLVKSSISMYENGKHEPNIETLNRIAACLDVPVSYLISSEQTEALSSFSEHGQNRLLTAFQSLDGFGKITLIECAEVLSCCDRYSGHDDGDAAALMVDMLYHGNKLVSLVNAWSFMSDAEQDQLLSFIRRMAQSEGIE